MTFESMVPWLLASTVLAFAVRKIAARDTMPMSFLAYNGLAAAVAVAGALAGSSVAVWVGGFLWLALVVVPIRLMALTLRRDVALDYLGAHRCATAAYYLHPASRTKHTHRFYSAMARATHDDFEGAAARLQAIRDDERAPGPMRLRADAERARFTGDWNGVLAPIETLSPLAGNATELGYLLAARVRACGEMGRLDDMLAAFDDLRATISSSVGIMPILNGALYAAVFSGRRAMAAKIVQLYGPAMPADSAQFWLASADLAAGGPAATTARASLQALARSTRQTGLAHIIARRLQRPLADPSAMHPSSIATLDAAQDVVGSMQATSVQPAARRSFFKRAPATMLIILANIVMFAVEAWHGDTMDSDTLYALGAMAPDAVTHDGQWWRLVAALFLHAGPAHIVANMLGLAAIGTIVERRYGALRFLFAYFVAGLGSMAAIIAFVHFGWVEQDIFVGASGAIMGLLGVDVVLIVQAGRGAYARREDKAQIWVVLAVIALQTTFDLSNPQVSFAAHAGGLVIGVVTALVLNASMRGHRRAG
jgi:rhomboid protease GluP